MTKDIRDIPFVDMYNVDEDDRIAMIGEQAASKNVAVLLEKDEPSKVRRYIRKVTERYPNVRHVGTVPGPVKSVVTVKFGPKGVQ